MAITGDNEYNIRGIPISDYCWSDDPDPVDLDTLIRLYLTAAWGLGLLGVTALVVLYLVL